MHKSTFCKMLMPDHLRAYYTDSFDLHSLAAAERKLGYFGLINLDEMDKYSAKKMVWLKNIQQMSGLSIRKAYQNHFTALPRMASFIGTSNRRDLLTDPTGSRRYLCVEIIHKIDCSPLEHKQLYAQLKAELESGERYWFTTEEEKVLAERNAPFHHLDAAEDVFHACYRLPQEEEKGVRLSAADILSELKKKNPVAMKEVGFRSFTESLIALGVQRFHTRRGNLYEVIPLCAGA
jgi:predicted P-loop ATPase